MQETWKRLAEPMQLDLILHRKSWIHGMRSFLFCHHERGDNPAAPAASEWGVGPPPHDFAQDMIMLRRRAAAEFMSTKPSGRMEARSLRRTVPVIRFHRRIRRRSRVVERECERRDGRGRSSRWCVCACVCACAWGRWV